MLCLTRGPRKPQDIGPWATSEMVPLAIFMLALSRLPHRSYEDSSTPKSSLTLDLRLDLRLHVMVSLKNSDSSTDDDWKVNTNAGSRTGSFHEDKLRFLCMILHDASCLDSRSAFYDTGFVSFGDGRCGVQIVEKNWGCFCRFPLLGFSIYNPATFLKIRAFK